MKRLVALMLLGLSGVCAFPDETWEPSDIHPVGSPVPAAAQVDVAQSIALDLIHLYQVRISPASISRCPFLVSCSNFALRAIARKGFVVGSVMFIDRFWYRENAAAFGCYELARTDDGFLKIDDGQYLE
jgi:putative component of membrane protein insertase Oxa1/YidC/SpoIIIJ protein YidD